MEDNPPSSLLDGVVIGVKFGMATRKEICTASISDSSISHASQLSNPFLGLPLEFGRCESCGTSEAGKCEGHFGYIELPTPIYHPSHISELKRMLSLVCLNCLKMRKSKPSASGSGFVQRLVSPCCEVSAAEVSIRDVKTSDGACYLALKVSKSKMHPDFWGFLEKYGYRYEGDHTRALLPCEAMEIIKRIPLETKRKLAGKGYFPQDGYLLKYLPVPPNCLSVPEVSDGVSVMASDPSITILRKLLRKVEIIKSSRSGEPNFESHHVEANDLQSVVDQYFQIRGTSKAARAIETRFGVNKELNESSTKAWLEKMRTLFIRKGSGFSSRNVITGDCYRRINEVGIPVEVAQRVTFEERVNIHNIGYLQKLVDENLCLTYKEGMSTFSLRDGSKGHIYLKPGQIVQRRIMDGDIVFINRPPTTHKHSLQALFVYIHDDHTVKINPLICGPLGADFDGDCVHLFYPQSLAAKAEVVELFSVENQLLSSHSGNLNLQLTTDSLLSLKMLVKRCFFDRVAANQLAMFLVPLPQAGLMKANSGNSYWTSIQMLQCALPLCFDCSGGRYLIRQSEILEFDFNRDVLPATVNEIAASIFFSKGPKEALKFFDVLQPFLMESIFADGFSVSLQDFSISRAIKRIISRSIGKLSSLLYQLRSVYNELVAQQLEKLIRDIELPVINFALKSTKLGDLIDSKSKSAIDKVVQQIGFLGQQLFDRGKFYSKGLVEDVTSHFHVKCCYDGDGYPSAEYGLLKGSFFNGLDPYEEMVHSISTREIMVRSSRGLSEPGTLFKNLMAILRDVVICYDGTVRNICSNSIIQFEYGLEKTEHLFPAGEPVGVLAATAMSNPAYKAVLDASPSSNSSWELMKEILQCKVNFKNEPVDRRVILYLNDCDCGGSYCRENAAYKVKDQLRKVNLKDASVEFIIEYQEQRMRKGNSETDAGLVGHIYLDEMMLEELKISMANIFQKCSDRLKSFSRRKKANEFLNKTELSFSESCSASHSAAPCLTFIWVDDRNNEFDRTVKILSEEICPVLLDTIIQGDPRISSASIIWVSPDTNTWVRNPYKSSNGELALDIILEKDVVKQSGDAWRIVLDSCLPVLHLIDTRRSIPYAIKQIQELLGISCTFDQAIQRVAASVKMVAKGVLREHLILLASSMTCGGNLVGFNTGGYKALCRQLNIQVPFTDATLFTPKKCFERAAAKCHTDSLSSVVASCSWGKHVAVGTGSKFDVVWDANKIRSSEIKGMDVYSFLHMVGGHTDGEEETDACLGEDIDDLLEEENLDLEMSSPHNSGFKAVFEDNPEVLNDSTSNGWDVNLNQSESKSNGWGANITGQANTNSNEWSGWGNNNSEIPAGGTENMQGSWGSGRRKDVTQEDNFASGAWGANRTDHTETKSNDWGRNNKSEILASGSEKDSWGSSKLKDDVRKNNIGSSAWDAGSTGQTKAKSNEWSGWGNNQSEIPAGGSENVRDSWGSDKGKDDVTQVDNSAYGSWGGNRRDQTKAKSNESSGWGRNQSEMQPGGSKNVREDSWDSGKLKDDTQNDNSESGAWGASSKGQIESKSNEWSGWGKNKSEKAGEFENVQDSWGSGKRKDVTQVDNSESGAWGARSTGQIESKSNEWSGWGKNKSEKAGEFENVQDSWGSGKRKDVTQVDNSVSGSWGGSRGDQTNTKSNELSGWGRNKSVIPASGTENAQDSWGSSILKDDVTQKDNSTSGSWGANKTGSSKTEVDEWARNKVEAIDGGSEKPQEDSWNSGNWKADSKVGNNSWGKAKSSGSQSWDSQNQSNQNSTSRGWESHIASANSDSEKGFQWGKQGRESFKKNRFEGSQGRGPNGGDWKNRNRPPRPPGQRLDLYSSEEQDVLKEIEPIMQSIRRIMQQQGYNDGDPLAAEDQQFILENVFEHHPDKETKMGAGIDYVMVNRHSSFQDSRCFFVVLKDGRREDFSYRKCLDNRIRKKYPADLAEAFVNKYFRVFRNRGDQTANPRGDQTRMPVQDEASTPADQTSTPGPVETNE
ncbi:DNA-directed RNA polymerase V subunit 1 DNA-directed RNA polymerase D subunit 1b [Vigna angularis]|uniref:DNA-directed RNA polymerase subunit n=1 Tax=Phaseolus angularis TaxID=3914 RepID=A0A8T0KCI9_PHAAN|nr:DNA-directed RNA polymerase V subunit 1 [Vigna angularis]KAG2396532.1 DNA-directed RNA polymerase V subunit 1 DNA-directed RNA polymerase D subunit 1b [Vigna angularis]